MNPNEQTDAKLCKVVILPHIPIIEAIATLDQAGLGILLVCDEQKKLLGTVTDGDIRRAMLTGFSFNEPIASITNKAPIVAHHPISLPKALLMMDHSKSFYVNQLPVLDEQGRVLDLILRSDLTKPEDSKPFKLNAVVMAGGFGTRLHPLTEDLPKPMLPVGDRPLLEHTIERLRKSGIRKVSLTTHYKPQKIVDHFGSGDDFGVEINYVQEDQPLGTAGALSLIEPTREPLLVINGDILTEVHFNAMFDYHQSYQAGITVAVRRYEVNVPYGILECDGNIIKEVKEKPTYHFFVNAGIYLLQPEIQQYIPKGTRFDMTDLIQKVIGMGIKVVSFPIREYWLDIGQHADYQKAQEDVTNRKIKK